MNIKNEVINDMLFLYKGRDTEMKRLIKELVHSTLQKNHVRRLSIKRFKSRMKG